MMKDYTRKEAKFHVGDIIKFADCTIFILKIEIKLDGIGKYYFYTGKRLAGKSLVGNRFDPDVITFWQTSTLENEATLVGKIPKEKLVLELLGL